MKHTKGEWERLSDINYNNSYPCESIHSNGKYICLILKHSEEDNSEANAKLITAAPDLLLALELVLNHCNKISAAHGQNIYNKMMTHKCIEMANNAIEKATS